MPGEVPEKSPAHHSASHRHDPTPLVIVEGFLGGAAGILWGNFEQDLNRDAKGKKREVIFTRSVP
jgi:hypothetical protein